MDTSSRPPQPQQQQQQARGSATEGGLGPLGANMDLSVPIVVGIEMTPEITIDARTGQVVGGPNGGGGGSTGQTPSSADVLSGFPGLQAGLQNLLQQQQQPQPNSNQNGVSARTTGSSQPATAGNETAAASSGTTASRQSLPRSIPLGGTAHVRVGVPPTGGLGGLGGQIGSAIRAALNGAAGGGGIGPRPNTNFDMILPCNSHHVAYRLTRQRAAAAANARHRSASVPPRREAGTSTGGTRASGGQAQSATTSTRASPSASPMRTLFGPPTVRAIDSNNIEQSLRSLIGSLVTDNAAATTGASGVGGDVTGMVNVVQRIIGQVLGATMGGPGGGGAGNGQTIADFLETISDYSYTSGQDIITDLLMCLARSLTFSDLIGFLTGPNAVVSKLREPLKEFLRTRLGVTGLDDISSAMRRVLDETHPGLEAAVAAANVRQGVDYPETLDNFFMQRLTPLVEQVWTSDEETFGRTFYDAVQTFLADLTNLSVSCFSDGQASLERLVRNQLCNVTDDVGSGAIGSWTVSTALGHLRNYVAGIGESSSVESYIIRAPNDRRAERARRTSAAAAAAAVATTTEASAADTEEDEESFETPRSSPEAMDVVATDDDEAAAGADVPAAVAVAAPSAPEEKGSTT